MVKELELMRIDKGLSKKQLAQKIGVSYQSINKWERGEVKPQVAQAFKLANFYGIKPREIFNIFDNNLKASNDNSLIKK